MSHVTLHCNSPTLWHNGLKFVSFFFFFNFAIDLYQIAIINLPTLSSYSWISDNGPLEADNLSTADKPHAMDCI